MRCETYTLTGVLENSNNTVVLSGAVASWQIQSGTVVGGTIVTTNGASLVVYGYGVLDGVTVDGVLDVGNTYSGGLAVASGLTLNGTLLLGNPTNRQSAYLDFEGSQTLGGTGMVVFGNAGTTCNGLFPDNAIYSSASGTVLTIGPGITIRGQNGTIGNSPCQNGPLSVINQGTISCDVSGGTMYVIGYPFVNQGLAQAINGGALYVQGSWNNTGTLTANASTLNLSGSWTSSGTITQTNGSVTLGGTFILSSPGVINSSGGVFYLAGVLENTSNTVVLDGAATTWSLTGGGTVAGGTIVMTNGVTLKVYGSGTLNGVTVDGVLDVGNTYSGGLSVANGLTLNGTLLVGNPTNQQSGAVDFAGTQTLGGNGVVVFGGNTVNWCGAAYPPSYPNNCLALTVPSTTLTIGPGMTVRGQNGTIGYQPCQSGGNKNVGVINEGAIMADVAGGAIYVVGFPFMNQGTAEALNGGGLYLLGGVMTYNGGSQEVGSWINNGTINASNSLLYVGDGSNNATMMVGGSTVASAGSIVASFANSGSIFANASWTLQGETISGGTIQMTNTLTLVGGGLAQAIISFGNDASLVVDGSVTLNGVTVNGLLDVGNSYGATLTVLNGLTLNGTMLVGNPTNNQQSGAVDFAGTETLGGDGTVIFGSAGSCFNEYINPLHTPANTLALINPGTTLTIGPGMTVRGQNGTVGYQVCQSGGNSSVSVVNQGTISSDVPGGTIYVFAYPFSNQGLAQAVNGGAIYFQAQSITNCGTLKAASGSFLNLIGDLHLTGDGIISSQPGATIKLGGSLLGNTRNSDQYAPLGTLELENGSHMLEAMSQDRGAVANAYIKNFAYGTILLDSGTQVTIVDNFTNSAGPTPECIYANNFILSSGATLLSGVHIYARLSQITGAEPLGGISQVPTGGGALTINISTGGSISTAGTSDAWTFLGRAGEHATVTVDTGSPNVVTPSLNYAFVQLFDPSMNLLAQASNTVPQQIVALLNETLPVDGTYTVAVQAPANQPAATSNYLLTVWDITSNPQSLAFNQQELGQITTTYSGNQWNVSGVSGEQIQFDLINESAPGMAFTLDGPNGWIGFSNLNSSSGLITLPFSGSYSLNAFGTGGAYGINYAFEMAQSAQTNLMEGESFTGSFVGNCQPQLLSFTVTNNGPLLITLNNAGGGNVTELYAQLGAPPTRGTFGWQSINPNSPNQQILIPSAIPGTYYILVYGNLITAPGAFTVQAVGADVFLTALAPATGLNSADITLTLAGGGFLPATTVALISANGTPFPGSAVSVDSFTQITATFASNTLPAGVYSLAVTVSGTSVGLTNCFQALSDGAANFASSLTVPGAIEQGSPATAYAQYANTGNAPMPAPLLVLTVQANGVQEALLGLDASLLAQGVWTTAHQPPGFGDSAQFLASGLTPGVLQPGDVLGVAVYWAGWDGSLARHTPLQWNLGVLKADNPTPIDWASLETSMQPARIPSDAWNAIFAALTNEVGATWGGYVTMLDNNASYLGRLGLNITDVSKLLPFEILQADGLCPMQTLASSVDASVIAPGLPLTFSRSFGERISQRYALGPLGRGWSHNWQYSLQAGSDGTVTITGPGGSPRIFQPDKRGGYFNQAGDYGSLAPDGSGGYSLTEKTGLLSDYAANGTLNYLQDLNGNRITLGYTGGLLTSLTHSSGQYIQIGYNGAGLIQTVSDQFGHQTVLTYDPANQHLLGSQYFDGRTATYTYNTTGSATQLHALTGSATSCCNWRYFNYDSLGRLIGTALSDNAEAITLSYETGGQVTVIDALTNSTQFFYDHRGLLTKTTDALGNLVQRSFDNNYNLVSVTDPAGKSYNYGYDSLGNLNQSTDPLGDVSQFTYTTTFNRLASVTDAKQNTTQYGYDSKGNLQGTTYANNSMESWTYDSFGNPQSWTNRRGHQTVYTNNVNGQITAKQFADGSLTTYGYDFQGNLTNAATFDTNQSPLELSTMIYDGSNRLAQITYPGGKHLNFTYDSNGRRTSSTDQLGHSLYYYYDDAGRLTSMTNELNALVVFYQYDPAGRIATKTLGNGMFTTYQYDPAGQVLGLTNALANGTLLSYFNYIYDSRGRRTSMASLDGQWTYTYDDIGQLTHAVLATATTNIPNQDLLYVYDAVGNRVQTVENGVTNNYTANNLNQYVWVGATNYIFDADGNLTQEMSSSGTTIYKFNDENRLIALTSPQGNWQYTYDALGNRTVVTAGGTQMRDVIDPIALGNVVGVYDGVGMLLTHYDHALELTSRTDSNGNPAFYIADASGNVVQLVNNTGAAINNYTYSDFGNVIRGVETIPNPFQFAGQWGVMYDANGMNYMRARFYSPFNGTFASGDPLRMSVHSKYSYVRDNPINRIDPTGLQDTAGEPNFGQSLRNRTAAINQLIDNVDNPVGIENGINNLNCANNQVQQAAPGFMSDLLQLWWSLLPTTILPKVATIEEPSELANLLIDEVKGSWGILNNNLGPGGSGGGGCGPGGGSRTTPPQLHPPNSCTNGDCGPGGSGNDQFLINGDPNQLNGPAGFALQNFVIASNLFDYEIFFENQTNATAPVQIVQIANPLSTNLNWQTFQLTEIAFGNTFIPIPPNVQHFQTNLPFSYAGVNFQVRIEAGINLANGQVFANFFSVDPATGLPPEAGVGFLGPEDGTGRGMGHVSYTIRPQSSLPEGLQIPNVAYIQFDENPVIATDQVDDDDPSQGIDTNKQAIVTIDNSSPYSTVTSPYVSTNASFTVCWAGTNNGPAIVAYDIYVSINNGPWMLWLAQTTNTCADFQGTVGSSYSFYSIAYDGAGEVQPAPPPAVSTIVAPHLPPQFAPVANQSIAVGQQLVFTNVVQDPDLPITFSLGAGTPAGAGIDTNGVFSWTPSCGQASTTNSITVWATDSYAIPLSNSVSFVVVVSECLQVSVGSTVMQVGTTSSVPVSIISTLPLTNLSFAIMYPTNRFTNWLVTASNNAVGTALAQSIDPSQTAFSLAAKGGQTFNGPGVIGSLTFAALPGASAFVPLLPGNVVGVKTDGSVVGNSGGQAGRVVVIGQQPLLEAWLGSNSTRMLTLYGNPGSSYQTLFNTNPLTKNWLAGWHVPMTNLYQYFSVNQTAPQIYYRAWEFSADPPILDLNPSSATNFTLLLYGLNGTNYVIEATTNLTPGGGWTPASNFMLTNSFQFIGIGKPTNNAMFFRAKRP